MKTLIYALALFLSTSAFTTLQAQSNCAFISVDAHANSIGEYAVKVTVDQTYDQEITVQGVIRDETNLTTETGFTISVPAGSLTAQTGYFFEMDPQGDLNIIISTVSPYSVTKNAVTYGTQGFSGKCPFFLSEDESKMILLSSEFQNLIQSRNDFLDKISIAHSNGISLDSIRSASLDAIQNENYGPIYRILGGTYENGEAFFNSMSAARNNFLQANPFVEANMENYKCQSCNTSLTDDVNYLFDNFAKFNTYRYYPEATEGSSKPCGSFWNQVKLGACATGCSFTTGGLATPFCGWLCWCTFCTQNSALATVLCAN